MNFQGSDQPSFTDLGAEKLDMSGMKMKKVNGITKEFDTVIPGYIGKPKGLKQIIFERGLWKNKMNLQDMQKKLGECCDFKEELGEIGQTYFHQGNIMLLSPKCHP